MKSQRQPKIFETNALGLLRQYTPQSAKQMLPDTPTTPRLPLNSTNMPGNIKPRMGSTNITSILKKQSSSTKADNSFTPSLKLSKPGLLLSSISKNKNFGDQHKTDDNNNLNNFTIETFTLLDVPNGFLPPAFKDCHLNNVVRSARRCLDHLKEVRECLSNLVGEDEQLSRGIKKVNPGPDILQLSQVAETLTILTREAFVPAHQLNQTAIALYNAEDFLRYPTDIRTFDTATTGRIKLSDPSFNSTTVQKLRYVVDRATEYYNKFDLRGRRGPELQDVIFTLMRAFQDLYTLTLGCQEVFKVFLYNSSKETLQLQQFLLSLQSTERSDMLTELQDLRRTVDELVIFLEKLSWGSFVVYRLASGKNVSSNIGENCMATPKAEEGHSYPAYPHLKSNHGKSKRVRSSKKKHSEDNVQTAGMDLADVGKKKSGSNVRMTRDTGSEDVLLTSTSKKLTKRRPKSKPKVKVGKDNEVEESRSSLKTPSSTF